jgi:hypothetical protein
MVKIMQITFKIGDYFEQRMTSLMAKGAKLGPLVARADLGTKVLG